MKIWEQVSENVREAFIAAALELEISGYEAEMFFISASQEYLEKGLLAQDVRLEYALVRESGTTEAQNESRLAPHLFHFRQALSVWGGLVSGITQVIHLMLREEMDWQMDAHLRARLAMKSPALLSQPLARTA